jgi:hypothetical protein
MISTIRLPVFKKKSFANILKEAQKKKTFNRNQIVSLNEKLYTRLSIFCLYSLWFLRRCHTDEFLNIFCIFLNMLSQRVLWLSILEFQVFSCVHKSKKKNLRNYSDPRIFSFGKKKERKRGRWICPLDIKQLCQLYRQRDHILQVIGLHSTSSS